jgi:hypothetical protein
MLNYFLETASFLPHGFCLLWRPDLVALHVVSDLSIGLAYFSRAIQFWAGLAETLVERVRHAVFIVKRV